MRSGSRPLFPAKDVTRRRRRRPLLHAHAQHRKHGFVRVFSSPLPQCVADFETRSFSSTPCRPSNELACCVLKIFVCRGSSAVVMCRSSVFLLPLQRGGGRYETRNREESVEHSVDVTLG